MLLTPGSEFVAAVGSGRPAQISRPDLSQSLSWEQGLLNFDQEPLASAVARVNRYSARHVVLADPALGAIPIDGVFRAGDPDAFVDGIVAVHPMRRRVDGDEIVLERR